MTEPQLHEATQRVREIIRSVDAEEITLGDFDIIAAGAIPWRILDNKLQVLLIHRPKYDDWSWPKGKLKRGEGPLAGALREVAEETGHSAAPAAELPSTRYLANGRPKRVRYWAMTPVGGRVHPHRGGGRGALAARRRRRLVPHLPA